MIRMHGAVNKVHAGTATSLQARELNIIIMRSDNINFVAESNNWAAKSSEVYSLSSQPVKIIINDTARLDDCIRIIVLYEMIAS